VNLHNEIMNLLLGNTYKDMEKQEQMAYKCGHRDARHQAAELSIYAEHLEILLKDVYDYATQNHGLDLKLARKVEKILELK